MGERTSYTYTWPILSNFLQLNNLLFFTCDINDIILICIHHIRSPTSKINETLDIVSKFGDWMYISDEDVMKIFLKNIKRNIKQKLQIFIDVPTMNFPNWLYHVMTDLTWWCDVLQGPGRLPIYRAESPAAAEDGPAGRGATSKCCCRARRGVSLASALLTAAAALLALLLLLGAIAYFLLLGNYSILALNR